jgi:8-hydroxy-5-deazaflavin:NADPH oxidoreductase
MKIAVVGGTGKEGSGMALRWAKAGHEVFIGSRDAPRAEAKAAELKQLSGGSLSGGENAWAVAEAAVVVLSVPYAAHRQTLESLKAGLAGRVLIDVTVPLKPPQVRRVHLPEGLAAALEAQAIVGPSIPVVASSDDPKALQICLGLIQDLGARAFDAGPLANAIALESLTPVLLQLNRQYKTSVGIRLTGV